MPKRKIFVGHGKTAAPAGSALGPGHKRGKTGGRGKWWNPPSDPATVKDLDEIKKIEKELNEDSKKRKRAPWTRMKGMGKIGGGGKK